MSAKVLKNFKAGRDVPTGLLVTALKDVLRYIAARKVVTANTGDDPVSDVTDNSTGTAGATKSLANPTSAHDATGMSDGATQASWEVSAQSVLDACGILVDSMGDLCTVLGIGGTRDINVGAATPGIDQDFDDMDISAMDDEITATAHGLQTGEGPVQATTTDTLPTGISAMTDYWIIRVDANTIQLATSRANALAGMALGIAADGAGTHTLASTATADTVPAVDKDVATAGDNTVVEFHSAVESMRTTRNNVATCVALVNVLRRAVGLAAVSDLTGGVPDVANFSLVSVPATSADTGGSGASSVSESDAETFFSNAADSIAEVAAAYQAVLDITPEDDAMAVIAGAD